MGNDPEKEDGSNGFRSDDINVDNDGDGICGAECFLVSFDFGFVFLLPGGRPLGRDKPGINDDIAVLVTVVLLLTVVVTFETVGTTVFGKLGVLGLGIDTLVFIPPIAPISGMIIN